MKVPIDIECILWCLLFDTFNHQERKMECQIRKAVLNFFEILKTDKFPGRGNILEGILQKNKETLGGLFPIHIETYV